MSNTNKDCKTQTLNHLHRIQGQLTTLEKYIHEDSSCEVIAQLSTAIAKSFDSLRTKTLEGFIVEHFAKDGLDDNDYQQLVSLLKLYKK